MFSLLEERFDKKEQASFLRDVLGRWPKLVANARFFITLLLEKHARTFELPMAESRILILEPNGMIGPGK